MEALYFILHTCEHASYFLVIYWGQFAVLTSKNNVSGNSDVMFIKLLVGMTYGNLMTVNIGLIFKVAIFKAIIVVLVIYFSWFD